MHEEAWIRLTGGPYSHGNLRRGLKSKISERPNGVRGSVGISKLLYPYAASVEGGAVPHRIPSVDNLTAKTLKFYWRKVGAVVYFESVNHPGQKGQAYLRIPLARAAARHNMVLVTYDFSL